MTVQVVDCAWGRQIVFDTDVYFWPLLNGSGHYNEGEEKVFERFVKEGDFVLDIGANIGCHSLALGRIVGEKGNVVSFEPQRAMYNALCGSIALNEMWQVHPHMMALGRMQGSIQVQVFDYAKANSFGSAELVGFAGANDPEMSAFVPMVRLDDFELSKIQRLDFIKIDVEGSEVEVLLGARHTLKHFRPVLYVENDREQRSEELIHLLKELGYQIWLHAPPLNEKIFPGVVSVMLLCVPEERADEVNLSGIGWLHHEINKPADMPSFGRHAFRERRLAEVEMDNGA